jgi:hypothetical protein
MILSDFENKKWYDLGVNLGEASVHVILGGKSLMNLRQERRHAIVMNSEQAANVLQRVTL